MKQFIKVIMLLFMVAQVSQAAWEGSQTSATITNVRTYQIGADHIRTQITIAGASHTCGTQPNILYFDSNKIPRDIVKTVLSLAFGAMAAGKSVKFDWDCSLAGGGYGWGVALSVSSGN